MGFSTAQGSSAHAQIVLKLENFVPCDMSLLSNGGSTGANSSDN